MNSGYIYILYNEMFKFYGDNVYKMGKTIDINKRLTGYTTSFIEPCEIKFLSSEVKNYSLAEQLIFKALKRYRIKNNREFFNVQLTQAIKAVEAIINTINVMTEDEINLKMNEIIKERANELKKEYKQITEPVPTKEYLFLKGKYPDKDSMYINSLVNFISLFYNDRIIDDDERYIKIKLLKAFEQTNNVKHLDISFNNSNVTNNINAEQFKEIQKIFKTIKQKPNNLKDIKKLYI